MILVTGATGNVGREVVGLLADEGERVAAVTRNPGATTVPGGARVVAGDPSRPATFAAALREAEALFLNPAAVGGAAAELMSLAAERNVRRVVLLSGLAVENGEANDPLAAQFAAIERAVKACGLPWTVLRPTGFAANALAWAPQIRSDGVVREAYGDAVGAPIHERDIAAVAARALTGSGHAGRTYALTGPQSLTTRDQIRIIGEVIGRDLSLVELPREEALGSLTSYHGIPETVATALLDGRAASVHQPARLTDTVEGVLGRPALTFAQWAADHGADFRTR